MFTLAPRFGACVALALMAIGCSATRPRDSYEPAPLQKRAESDAAADPDDEIYGGRDGGDDFNLGGGPGATGGSQGGDTGSELTPQQALEAKLVGDYYLRSDVYSSTQESGAMIDTDATAFSLVKIGFDAKDGALKMIDWQCEVSIAQTCPRGCSNPSTKLLANGGRAYLPAKRALTVDASTGAWSTGRCAYALGWKWDFASDPNGVLPTADSDPLVYDPDGMGPGINSTFSVTVPVIGAGSLNRVCKFRLTQKIDVTYAGKLAANALGAGQLQDTGSDQKFLTTDGCDGKPSNSTRKPSTVRFARAPTGKSFNGTPWPCPSLSEFQAALPTP